MRLAWRGMMFALLAALPACSSRGTPEAARRDPYPISGTDDCVLSPLFIVFFRPNSTDLLNERGGEALRGVLERLREDGGYALVEGHTDRTEGRRPSAGLDVRRAEFVRDWLLERGVQPSRIRLSVRGDRAPISAAAGAAEMNRRVEIVLTHAWQACHDGMRRLRIDWFRRNCFPVLRTNEPLRCEEILDWLR
jgi:outer membrane protein OmpA-like peptidoglycan-associated protein